MATAALVALALALPGAPAPVTPTPTPTPAAMRAAPSARVAAAACPQAPRPEATLCAVNAQRRAHGVAPIRRDAKLEAAARAHARDMVVRRYFGHVSPDGATLRSRVAQTGWMRDRRQWSIGEDLAWGAGAAAAPGAIVQAWMNSPPHRRILLSPRYRVAGIGLADGTPTGPGAGATYDADFGS